jgi:hypothetical protein
LRDGRQAKELLKEQEYKKEAEDVNSDIDEMKPARVSFLGKMVIQDESQVGHGPVLGVGRRQDMEDIVEREASDFYGRIDDLDVVEIERDMDDVRVNDNDENQEK